MDSKIREKLVGLKSCEPLAALAAKHPHIQDHLLDLAECIRQDVHQDTGASPKHAHETSFASDPSEDSVNVFGSIEDPISFLAPRGRFNVSMSEDTLVLTKAPSGKAATSNTSSATYHVHRSNVKEVFKAEIEDKYQSNVQFLFAILLKEPLTVGKSSCHAVTFVCSESKTRYPLRVSRPVESIKLRPPGATLVTELQGQQKLSDLDQVVSPDGTLILSPSSMSSVLGATLHGVHEVDNTGSCGEYCIECYHKVTIGRLWLTKQGVLFGPRPLIFLPWEKIASMSINRQGSQTSSFDLVLHSDDNDKTEFRMIEGKHSDVVNDYINNNFEYAKEAGAADNEKTEENNGGDNSDEDDDSEQDENQTGSSSDSESDSDSGNESDDSDASADSDDKYLAEQAKKALGEDVEGALSRRSLRSREVNVVSEESSAENSGGDKDKQEPTQLKIPDKADETSTDTESEAESSSAERKSSPSRKRQFSDNSSSGEVSRKITKTATSTDQWMVE